MDGRFKHSKTIAVVNAVWPEAGFPGNLAQLRFGEISDEGGERPGETILYLDAPFCQVFVQFFGFGLVFGTHDDFTMANTKAVGSIVWETCGVKGVFCLAEDLERWLHQVFGIHALVVQRTVP